MASDSATHFAMTLVVTVLLLIFTTFTFASHFVPQIASSTDATNAGSVSTVVDLPNITSIYMKLFFSHVAMGVSGDYYQNELRMSYWVAVKANSTDLVAFQSADLSRRMIAAWAFALLGIIFGGIGTITAFMSLAAPPRASLDATRIFFTAAASIFCLVAMALVVGGFHLKSTKAVRQLVAGTEYGTWKLSNGLIFIAIGFAGFFVTFFVDLICSVCLWSGCYCAFGTSPSRDAWEDGSSRGCSGRESDKFSYGGPAA